MTFIRSDLSGDLLQVLAITIALSNILLTAKVLNQ